MEQIVVKTEVQSNGEILLFYLDENAVDENGDQILHLEEASGYEILDENIQSQIEQTHDQENDNKQFIQHNDQHSFVEVPIEAEIGNANTDNWSMEEMQKLVVFFIDNKESFNSFTNKQHLWNVACNAILTGRTAQNCELKLRELKRKYSEQHIEHRKGYNATWPLYDLCHQAFHDDKYVGVLIKDYEQQQQSVVKLPMTTTRSTPQVSNPGTIVVKNISTRPTSDDKVETMLKLYLRYKNKEITPKNLWETIAIELGEDGAEYWHKRFLNYKQHYLRILPKRAMSGDDSVNWRYMHLFDQIFSDDAVFQNKYVKNNTDLSHKADADPQEDDWNDAEYTILAKYCFDCFDEFQDPTIPNNFLWMEIGRLLDKKPEVCKFKYEEIKAAHYKKYFNGTYSLQSRVSVEIILDNIISQEIELEMSCRITRHNDTWSTEELDKLVNFFYENAEMFKDSVCYFVCWACVTKSLNRDLMSCRKQWDDLKVLYKSILQSKMENSDLQIEWRYIDIFDRIFDYGMDTNFLEGYEKINEKVKPSQKIGVQKVKINMENDNFENGTDEEEFDERGFTKGTKRGLGGSKAFKILEYYQKNKEKFSTTQRKKQTLWNTLAKQLGITVEQCAHRFRNLKQVYTSYVQREINKPEMPIFWPYYALCKKVFGYRAIKSKLKNSKQDSDEAGEWTAKEIKTLIAYFKVHFEEISSNDDIAKWKGLAKELGRSSHTIRDKFNELKKSYRRLKNVKENNPEYKVMWKYYNMFDEIYGKTENVQETMDIDEDAYETTENKTEDDDEYQCIIVIPEESDTNEASESEMIIQENGDMECIQNVLENVPDSPNVQEDQNYLDDQNVQEGLSIQEDENVQYEGNIQEDENNQEDEKYQADQNNQEDLIIQEDQNIEEDQNVEEYCTEDKQSVQNINNIQDVEPHIPVLNKWTKRSKRRLLILYHNYIKARKGQYIKPKEMWAEIASKLPGKTPMRCRKIFAALKNLHAKLKDSDDANKDATPYYTLLERILSLKAKYSKSKPNNLQDRKTYKNFQLPTEKVESALKYYLENIEEFTSPKFEKKYLWTELAQFVGEPLNKIFNKINYLKQNYNVETGEVPGEEAVFNEYVKEILSKENILRTEIVEQINSDELEVSWSDDETEQLLVWYLANLDKFKNPKFVRKYLWLEVSSLLQKTPMACSKKMSEVRTQYKTMIKENPEGLVSWRFYELCQKIYGTGKKVDTSVLIEQAT